MQVLSEGTLLAQVFYQVMSRLHLRVWELSHWGEELPFMIHPNMIRALLLKNYMRKCLHLKNMTEKTLLMTLQLMKLINYTHKMDLRFSRRRKVARRKILVIKHKRMII